MSIKSRAKYLYSIISDRYVNNRAFERGKTFHIGTPDDSTHGLHKKISNNINLLECLFQIGTKIVRKDASGMVALFQAIALHFAPEGSAWQAQDFSREALAIIGFDQDFLDVLFFLLFQGQPGLGFKASDGELAQVGRQIAG